MYFRTGKVSLGLLGNIMESDNSMKTDCDLKRYRFIGKIHSLSQEFGFSSPEIKIKLFNLYTTSFYGSSLYRQYSNQRDRLYHAYNICVRDTYRVPRQTHKYLIQTISQCMHPKVMICSRFVKLVETLNKCSKPSISLLINLVQNDQRTVCGKNLLYIANQCQLEKSKLTSYSVKNNMKYCEIPDNEKWREGMLYEMLLYRNCNFVKIDNFLRQEIDDIIDMVCTI